MKCIVKALNETDYQPRKKWWGFVKDGVRILCRYNHIMIIFKDREPIYVFHETRTDKIGVDFALRYMTNGNKQSIS